MPKNPPYAIVSCDIDTVDRHLEGYGFEGLPACDLVYRTAVPRLLELLDELDLPAVFFTIGRDAEAQAPLLRSMVAAGHEVASHSLTHPQPFSTLPPESLRDEIETSRAALTKACGTEVIGFRAPAWDIDDRVLEALRAAGYRYDASVFPTPVLIASRLAAYGRSTGKHSLFSMDLIGHAFSPQRPHRLTGAGAGMIEFPISVSRWLRLPVYHTMTYLVPPRLFGRWVRRFLEGDAPLCYELHAADLLDLDGDRVDPRLARHPGMSVPFKQKRQMLREILQRIGEARSATTYRAVLETGRVA